MALKTPCQTPGALFHTTITEKGISVVVDFPKQIALTEEEAKVLDKTIHNALELALAPLFITNK